MSEIVLVLLVVLSSSGCATKMALDANQASLANSARSIGIFTLRTENAYKPAYEPEVTRIEIKSRGSKAGKTFAPTAPYQQQKNKYLEYLVSVELKPGNNSLGLITGQGRTFPIAGTFMFPVNARFNLTNGVTYLGHLTMTNRQRKKGEARSGPVIPFIDQSMTGFSGGAFDVTISDRSETDIPDFIQAYPKLKNAIIAKAIMQR